MGFIICFIKERRQGPSVGGIVAVGCSGNTEISVPFEGGSASGKEGKGSRRIACRPDDREARRQIGFIVYLRSHFADFVEEE
jgi:hypothetical protein